VQLTCQWLHATYMMNYLYIHDNLFILFHLSLTIKTRMVNPLVLFLVLLEQLQLPDSLFHHL
jgi:hypothetical protein